MNRPSVFKHRCLCAILLVFVLVLSACSNVPNTTKDAVYIREGLPGMEDYAFEPILIHNIKELETFCAWYHLEEEYAAYDTDFFSDNHLLLVCHSVDIIPAQYQLQALTCTNGTLTVNILECYPEGKKDTSYQLWLFPIPLDKEIDISAITDIVVNVTEETAEPETASGTILPSVCIADAISSVKYINFCLRSAEELALFCNWYGIPPESEAGMYYAACDDAFFSKHDLLILPQIEGSGSNRHEVKSITPDENGNLSVTIARIFPPNGTADMAYWQIIVPIEKDLLSSNGKLIVEYTTVQIEEP